MTSRWVGGIALVLVLPSCTTPGGSPADADATPETPGLETFVDADGGGRLAILPEILSFGPVDVGCLSWRQQACVVNLGQDAVDWRGFPVPGCATFRVVDQGSLPLHLPPGQHVCADFVFAPVAAGSIACDLPIDGYGSPDVPTLHLAGTGGNRSIIVDEFIDGTGDHRFFLSRFPQEDTIEVFVQEANCPAGDDWRFDVATNAVIFNPEGSCYPPAGSSIWIRYVPACMPG